YGIFGGILLFVYSTFLEAIFRTTIGKFIVGLEVRSVRGPMTFSKAVVRNIPKLFWFAFPLLDTLAGLVVDGDPRRRWSDNVLGKPDAVVIFEAPDASTAADFMVQFSRVTDATTSLALPIEEFKWTW